MTSELDAKPTLHDRRLSNLVLKIQQNIQENESLVAVIMSDTVASNASNTK